MEYNYDGLVMGEQSENFVDNSNPAYMSSASDQFQPSSSSGFVSFMNDFFTPANINAIGGLFTKPQQQFNNPQDFQTEKNYTGVLIATFILIALVVVAVVILKRK